MLLAAPPRAVIRLVGQHPAIIRVEEHQRLFRQTQAIQRPQHFPHPFIQMLNQRHQSGPFVRQSRFPLLHPRQPLWRWLDRVVRGVISQVEEEWLARFGPFLQILTSPIGKYIRRVPLGINHLLVAAQEIVTVPQMRPIIVHHVPQETVEEIKPALGGGVWRMDAEMPFPYERRVVPRRFEQFRQQHRIPGQVSPRITRAFLADHPRHADQIRVAPRQQSGPARRTNATIGEEVVKRDPFPEQPVHVRGSNVSRSKSAVVTPALVIGKDDQDVRLLRRGCHHRLARHRYPRQDQRSIHQPDPQPPLQEQPPEQPCFSGTAPALPGAKLLCVCEGTSRLPFLPSSNSPVFGFRISDFRPLRAPAGPLSGLIKRN